jgi:hypothetical protein
VSSCLHVYPFKALEELSHVRAKSGASARAWNDCRGAGLHILHRGRSLSRIAIPPAHLTTPSHRNHQSGLGRLGSFERLLATILRWLYSERINYTRSPCRNAYRHTRIRHLHLSPRVLFIGTLLRHFYTFSPRTATTTTFDYGDSKHFSRYL